jgi:hypothetical protein
VVQSLVLERLGGEKGEGRRGWMCGVHERFNAKGGLESPRSRACLEIKKCESRSLPLVSAPL